MTDTIEQKALALVNEVRTGYGWSPHLTLSRHDCSRTEALCRAIEQHEAFRQEVSDALLDYFDGHVVHVLTRFIIAKPDPLVEALTGLHWAYDDNGTPMASELRAAIEKRGGKIVWGEG